MDGFLSHCFPLSDVDTDTLEADPDNVEEEIVEILVREDTTVIE